MATFEDVILFLESNPGNFFYGDVAEGVGLDRAKGGQAVGSMMRAIHARGRHDLCRRVRNTDTGMHGCDVEPDEE